MEYYIMNNHIIDNYMIKCYKNTDNKFDEEYCYFCDIEDDKIYYINNKEFQCYPVLPKKYCKIIKNVYTILQKNKDKGDNVTEKKYFENSNEYANNDKLTIIIRVLFFIVFCIIVFS